MLRTCASTSGSFSSTTNGRDSPPPLTIAACGVQLDVTVAERQKAGIVSAAPVSCEPPTRMSVGGVAHCSPASCAPSPLPL